MTRGCERPGTMSRACSNRSAGSATVANLSLGSADTPDTDPVEQAVDTLSAQDETLFVVAAGNSGPAASPSFSGVGPSGSRSGGGPLDGGPVRFPPPAAGRGLRSWRTAPG